MRYILLSLVLLFANPIYAQVGVRSIPNGYCYSNSLGTATKLNAFTGIACNGLTPNQWTTNSSAICAYVVSVVWRDDGTAPTSTPGTGGQELKAGSCMSYNGDFSKIQFIQEGTGAIVGISMWK